MEMGHFGGRVTMVKNLIGSWGSSGANQILRHSGPIFSDVNFFLQ